MNLTRSLAVHAALLALATVLALVVWTREDAPAAEQADQFEVWGGRPDDIKSVSFTSDKRKVLMEAHKDSVGRWYVATVDREVQRRSMPAPVADAGADAILVGSAISAATDPAAAVAALAGVARRAR